MNQALWIKKFGAPEVLEIAENKLLAPARDEVQVKVYYSGINFAEIVMRQGLYRETHQKGSLYQAMNLVVK